MESHHNKTCRVLDVTRQEKWLASVHLLLSCMGSQRMATGNRGFIVLCTFAPVQATFLLAMLPINGVACLVCDVVVLNNDYFHGNELTAFIVRCNS